MPRIVVVVVDRLLVLEAVEILLVLHLVLHQLKPPICFGLPVGLLLLPLLLLSVELSEKK